MDDYSEIHEHDGVHARLTAFPNTTSCVISHEVYLPPQLRGEGRGSSAHRKRLQDMSDLGFRYALCTVREDNDAERKILHRNGWRVLTRWQSSYTYEGVMLLYGRHIS